MKELKGLFQDLGLFGEDYTIPLREDAKLYSIPTSRCLLLPLMKETQKELIRIKMIGVISRVEETTEWCSTMVVVPKDNRKVRICVNQTKLNAYVKREFHMLPTVDDVLSQLDGAQIMSKLDANSGYWQIPLSHESRQLTTFITPFGRFQFNRLPFGITSASEV